MLDRIRIVLVEPRHPGNIGSTARAMKTMGIEQLVLVAPARFPDPQADWRAAGAVDVLDGVIVVSSVAEAIAECHFVVGTSTRSRHIPWPVVMAKDIASCLAEQPPEASIAILFGREDSGLTTKNCKCASHLHSLFADYGSQTATVQVVCYELYQFIETQQQQDEESTSAIYRRFPTNLGSAASDPTAIRITDGSSTRNLV